MATHLDQYREILALVQIQMSFAEKNLATKKRQQAELLSKAAQLLANLSQQLIKAQDFAGLKVAEKWQVQVKLKACAFRHDADTMQPGIANLQQDLRSLMKKKIILETLIKKAELAVRRAEEQSASDNLLALDILRRRLKVNKR